MLRKLLSLAVLVTGYHAAEAGKLPSYIHTCHRSDPNVGDCTIKAINALRPKLIEGIPEIGMPSIEPWKMPGKFPLLDEPGIKAIGYDITVSGASKFIINDLQADLEDDHAVYLVDVTFPYLNIEANYEADMKLLSLIIKGDGIFKANLTGVDAKLVIKGRRVIRNGVSYFQYYDIDPKANMKDINVRLENLFNGDKEIGEAVNKAINDDKKALLELFKPKVLKLIADHLMAVANSIFVKYTYDDILPAK